MEEVDGIILKTLNNIGCDTGDAASISELPVEVVIDSVALCIETINNHAQVPHRLPPNMAARFRVGNILAKAVQELGFRGDVGYQTFLYSNEVELRHVFMFLVEKLPKETPEGLQQTTGGWAVLNQTISDKLSKLSTLPWLPSHRVKSGIRQSDKSAKWHRQFYKDVKPLQTTRLSKAKGVEMPANLPKETLRYYLSALPYVTKQPCHHGDVAPSLLEQNANGVAMSQAGSDLSTQLSEQVQNEKFQKRVKLAFKESLRKAEQAIQSSSPRGAVHLQQLHQISGHMGSSTAASSTSVVDDRKKAEEEARQQTEQEMELLRKQVEQLNQEIVSVESEMSSFTSQRLQMEATVEEIMSSNKEQENAFKTRKRTFDLLPDGDENISKLQQLVDSSRQRIAQLAEQWEKHRQPLQEEYRHLRATARSHQSETELKLQEVKEMRGQIKVLATDARTKEELLKQLTNEYAKMAKDINRSAYTRRILEIINNIKKQQEDIDKVLADTRQVQKEINYLTGKLDRSYTVTDEMIFKNAKKDEISRKAYKLLASLHENFQVIVKLVEETGEVMREIRELEDQVEHKSKNKVLDNLEKITSDYKEMKKENSALLAKLKDRES